MNKKAAIVTGGAGFIGSHLAEELPKGGYQVISILHRKRTRFGGGISWEE